MKLEEITDKTCAYKIQAMKSNYTNNELIKCKLCQYYESAYVCYKYKPYKNDKHK